MKLNFSTSAKTFWKVTTYVYGHLEAENLVRVRHSGAGKQSLQYPQRMAFRNVLTEAPCIAGLSSMWLHPAGSSKVCQPGEPKTRPSALVSVQGRNRSQPEEMG